MYFDRFDICAAYYCFAALYHEGQFSDTYKILGRLHKLKPYVALMIWQTPGLRGDRPENLSENAREIFDGLVAKSGNDPYKED